MGLDIAELYQEELKSLNEAIDLLGIPADVFSECGTSFLELSIERDASRIVNAKSEAGEFVPPELISIDSKGSKKFERLCKSAPHLSADSLSAISLAYGAILIATNNGQDMSGLESAGGSEMKSLKILMTIATTRGIALGHCGLSAGVLKIVQENMARKKMLSDAASKIHVENRAAKADAFAWLDANFSTCTSMDDAAGKMAGKLVPYTFRTVRDWVGEWKKLRSTGTP